MAPRNAERRDPNAADRRASGPIPATLLSACFEGWNQRWKGEAYGLILDEWQRSFSAD